MSWSPTHVQVAVQRAKDLKAKGKNGTNDVYVSIHLKKEKYQTSLKEKAVDPEWYEECDLLLFDNYAQEGEVELTAFHRNGLGLDEFLGRLALPLKNFQIYDPPKSKWYALESKSGHKSKPRGELEVRICYVVNKVRDTDTVSTASSASKKIKKIKGVASSIGKKITGKGNKPSEMTSDYIPDLTGLDKGVLDMDDIAENYAKPPASPASTPNKKDRAPKKPNRSSTGMDAISLPGEAATRGEPAKHSPLFKKLSPAFGRKKAPAPPPPTSGPGLADTPPSSNASAEDIQSRTSSFRESSEQELTKGHKRMGSHASNVSHDSSSKQLSKAGKPTSKSFSTWDISNTSAEFDLKGRSGSDADQRLRPGLGAKAGEAGLDPKEYKTGGITAAYKVKPKTKSGGLSIFKMGGSKAQLVDDDDDAEGKISHPKAQSGGSNGSQGATGSSRVSQPMSPTTAVSTNPFLDYEGGGSGVHHATVTGKLSASSDTPAVSAGSSSGGLFGLFRSSGERKRERASETPNKSMASVSTQTVKAEYMENDGVPVEYQNLSKKEMCDMIDKLKSKLKGEQSKNKDLEDYIDTLLLRVLDRNPSLLHMATAGTSAPVRNNGGIFAT